MHKKLESDLISLAHSILQLKSKDDVNALHQKASEVYEKLSLLKFVNYYFETTPTAEENKEDVIEKITRVWVKNDNDELEPALDKNNLKNFEKEEEKKEEEKEENSKEQPQMTLFEEENTLDKTEEEEEEEEEDNHDIKNVAQEVANESPTNENNINKKNTSYQLIKIPLNDRINIVNHLFEGNQSDFNRVLSQLNSFNTLKEAKNFINRMVKPDYNWSEYEETENTLTHHITKKFQ